MRTLFLITARGGSKGVPRKNLCTLGGLSLIGFKAIAAQGSKFCTRLILSSDCPEIQREARRHGVEVPFTRPAELATDIASSSAVIRHAMQWIEENCGETYDAIALLEPSSPFARSCDFDRALDMLIERQANAVVGVRKVEHSTVVTGPLGEQGRLTAIIDKMTRARSVRRQDLPQEYTMNGALYVFRWDYFRQHHNIYHDRDGVYGYEMDPHYSVEIDSPFDLDLANFLIDTGRVDMSHWAPQGGADAWNQIVAGKETAKCPTKRHRPLPRGRDQRYTPRPAR